MSTERSVELLQEPPSRGDVRCDDRESKPIHVLAKAFVVALEGEDFVRELGVETMKRGEDDLLFDSEVCVERALEPIHRRLGVPPLHSAERLRDLADEDIELPVLRRDARSLAREPYPQSRLVPGVAAHTLLSGGATDRPPRGVGQLSPPLRLPGFVVPVLYSLSENPPRGWALALAHVSGERHVRESGFATGAV